jgi:uncharacterized membrane protein YoaK (UPF0700 family)
MFNYRLERNVPKQVYYHWFLLSFLAGNVNAGGFLACDRFVTHVTGFATLFGVAVGHGNLDIAIGILTVPFFFLLGSMISAYLVDRNIHFGRSPRYDFVMGLVGICLVIAAVAGKFELFTHFGDRLRMKQDYFFLVLLCISSGLQNAAISTSSGSTIRTTHLTGLTTDMGIGIVRALFSKSDRNQFLNEVAILKLRTGSVASFVFGSVTGAFLFLKTEYLGFLMPAALAFYVMAVAKKLDSFSSSR